MSVSQWSVISAIITIVLFVASGLAFAYKGFKEWINIGGTNTSKANWGKFEFCLGIVLFILAIVFVVVSVFLVRNGAIILPPEGEITESPTPTESPITTASSIFISDFPYQGAVYTGYVNELRQPDGKGTMTYSDGSEYVGDWVDGVQQGYGKMIYNNGIYEGEWQNGKRNGEGIYTWNDGRIYKGGYLDDVRSGQGTFYGWVDLTNGYSGTYYGESKNDQFDGYGYFLFDNGDEFEGIYKENLFWTGIYTIKDVGQYEVVNGQPQ